MKKYGKFEKMPDGTRAKQPPVKSMLLQAYFASLLCLVLCVTMFLGTTFAWFTSEVTNAGNEIYIGVLDVDLQMNGVSLGSSETKVFDNTIRWEPGYTALRDLTVVNKGDLAFNYTLNFTDGKPGDEDDDLEKLAECFEVWVYSNSEHTAYVKENNETFAEMTAKEGWTKVGTLADVLAGKAVFSGSMTAEDVNAVNDAGEKTAHTYTIALHMKESAENITNEDGTNSLMGKSITLNVKLTAYQMCSEQDDFGSNYDTFTAVSDAEELTAALAAGSNVVLMNDIDLEGEQITVPTGVTATLDLNGYGITSTEDEAVSLITNEGNLTINGEGSIALTFNGVVDESKAANTIANRGVLTVNGGAISNSGTGSQIGYAIDNYNGATLTVNGGTITASGSSYYDGIRLFCGNKETTVTINGGEVSSIWAQNPSADKATEVKGTVVINGGEIGTTYYENFTIVKVAEGITANVEAYGNGSGNTTTAVVDGYTVYSFVQSENG